MSCPTRLPSSSPSSARVYRPRRPAKTLLHQIARENLETYLADLNQGEGFSAKVPLYVEAAFREYLKCGLLGVFLRAVETTVRRRSPGSPAGSRFGAVVFVHRFGRYLNSHIHYHVLVTDGVFSAGQRAESGMTGFPVTENALSEPPTYLMMGRLKINPGHDVQ